MPTPEQLGALRSVVETQAPIVQIETHDEPRVLALCEQLANATSRELWTWSAARGLRVARGLKLALRDFESTAPAASADTTQLPDALAQVQRMKGPALVVLLDIHPYLSNPLITRALKELALQSEAKRVQLLLVGHDIALPAELQPWSARFAIEPMTLDRVRALFKDELARAERGGARVGGQQEALSALLRHLVGLPEPAVRHLVRLTLSDGQVTAADLARVLSAKHDALGAAELLVFESELPALTQVAGMAALKRWLALRREPFVQGPTSGLPPPRGVLLLGVQGAGKSLAAKAVAASWQVPLFRMDFGALFDKFQGESERKLREALKVAEAMQPCVLWMDEIEKGLAGGDGAGGDSTGTGKRMLGTLLTWMAERRGAVFLVATANDIEGLPPELMRKGRFDEIFFVDLPTPAVRDGILRIHLARHSIPADDAALQGLVEASDGFSGAEIEAAIVAARYEAHALGRQPPQAALVRAEMQRTRPLSVTRAEAIAALRAWAAGRTVSAD